MDQKVYNSSKVFTNSAIFNIDFLLSVLSDQHWNYSFGRSYRAKSISIQSFDPQLEIMNQAKGYLFEKDFTDLFWFTKNFEIVEIEGDVYFPIITKTGTYSPGNAARVLSNLHKRWLGLDSINS